jgi:hypothetical protein
MTSFKNEKNKSQQIADVARTLKRRNLDVDEADLIVEFLSEHGSIDGSVIKSMGGVWEIDSRPGNGILHARYFEWKHEREKQERNTFYKHYDPLKEIKEKCELLKQLSTK